MNETERQGSSRNEREQKKRYGKERVCSSASCNHVHQTHMALILEFMSVATLRAPVLETGSFVLQVLLSSKEPAG
jgi:hypothetical protein